MAAVVQLQSLNNAMIYKSAAGLTSRGSVKYDDDINYSFPKN